MEKPTDTLAPLREIPKEFVVFLRWLIASLIDAGFLVAWVWLQHTASSYIEGLVLSDIDKRTVVAFQILFAVATLAPVLFYIVKDVTIMAMRTWAEIRAVHAETSLQKVPQRVEDEVGNDPETEKR